MSDIEDYAYSPYDDLEDIMYDADPAPELADDLAEHALHSPVYQDEDAVKNELQEYFSDWNYYSDDYMDDDPILLRKNPQDGSSPKRSVNSKQSVKRGKKRKLAQTQDVPALDLDNDQLLTRCIKGTMWAKPADLKIPLYKDGQEKKVALIKDWKKVFAVKDNGWGQSSVAEDESWANDMSLADMGLRSMMKQSSFEQDKQEAGEDAEFDEEAENDAQDVTGGMAAEVIPLEDTIRTGSSKLRNAILLEEDDGGGGERHQRLPVPEDLEDSNAPRKRRRVQPNLPSPPDSNEAVAVTVEEGQGVPKVAACSNSNAFILNSDKIVEAIAPLSSVTDMPQSRKRKATDDPESSATGSTSSSRAKRVASSVTSNSQPMLPASRTTRSTKTK